MKRTEGNILIRADAGPGIGSGRVLRCIDLARSLSKLHYHVDFACGTLPSRIKCGFARNDFGMFALQDSANAVFETHDINDLILATQPVWVVLDGRPFDENYQRRLQLGTSRLLVIEDNDRPSGSRVANVVLRQTLGGESIDSPKNPTIQEILVGPEYILAATDSDNANAKRMRVNIKRLLIALQGPLAPKTVCCVLDAVGQFTYAKMSIDIVVCPQNSDEDLIRNAVAASQYSIRVHRGRDRLPSLAAQVDMAIVNTEQIYSVLAKTGVPTIILAAGKQESPWKIAIQRNGAGVIDPDNGLGNRLPKLIRSTANDLALRRRMVERSRSLIDGHGSERIARMMAIAGFRCRPVRLDDAQRLYDWWNDPELRAVCIDQDTVAFDSHRQWLKERIESDQVQVFVIEDPQGLAVGNFQLKYDSDFRLARLNIVLIPSFRGRGMGTALIEYACRQAVSVRPELEIFAVIKANNLMTQRAFQKAGFRLVETIAVNGQVARRFSYQQPLANANKPIDASLWRRKAS